LRNTRIAKRYARALFNLGQQDGSYLSYGRELREFVACFINSPDLKLAISSPIFDLDARKSILNSVLNKCNFSVMVNNFLNLLLDKKRIGEVQSINEYYSKLTDEVSNISHAEIITAVPLKKAALDKVINKFEGLISKSIKATVIEDPDILGGIIVKIGDTFWDGSIRTQIEGLRESFRRGE
jgi:F-type H+-transporting ATPase subunit delta